MTLTALIKLIDAERQIKAKIDAELTKWGTPREGGDSPLRWALGASDQSLRAHAKMLQVSPTYLSMAERGLSRPSRQLMRRVHEVFGLGSESAEGERVMDIIVTIPKPCRPQSKLRLMIDAIEGEPGIRTDALALKVFGESTRYTRHKIAYLREDAKKRGYLIDVTDHAPRKPGKNFLMGWTR